MKSPHGAFAPIPTPLDGDDIPDHRALAAHLGFVKAGGLDGVLVLGTNGEFPSFDVSERLAFAEATARFGSGLQLMLGVGSCALPEVVQMIQAAKYFDFDSVLLPPPFYFRSAPTTGLAAFVLEVLDNAELPVLLYHIPQVTGVAISDELLDAVDHHRSFGGIKDSSGDEGELDRFTRRGSVKTYMVGNDRLLSAARAAGGSGSITASASVVPELVAATQRDAGRQPELDAVRGLLEEYGLGPAVKAILRHKDIGPYRTRPPLIDLDDDAATELIRAFDVLAGR